MAKTLNFTGIKSCGQCPAYWNYSDDMGDRHHICNIGADLGYESECNPEIISADCPLPNTPEDEAPGQFEFECVFHTYRNGAGSQMKIEHTKTGLVVAELEQSALPEITRRKMLLKNLYDAVQQRLWSG